MSARLITPGLVGIPDEVDVVVVGLGITGAGVALDAVTRGLTVLAVDAHDLAFGTSRWSSKLVHGGLRYLAQGQLAIAHESAVERGILMDTTAPHLVRPLPMLTPVNDVMTRGRTAMTWAGLHAGDVLRRTAHTSARTLPRPRRLNATEALNLAPALRADTLRGGLLAWDGQLEDDARLVTTVARTAASYGAEVRTRARVTAATGTRVELRDELTGQTYAVRAQAVVNATGVWAGDLDDQVRLRPSRGTHLVLRGSVLPHTRVAVMVPIPGASARFAMVLPQPDGTLYVGLTDEPVTGPVPDVPVPSEAEIDFLLGVVASAFTTPPGRDDVVGAFAGLRPLLEVAGTDATSDLSRRHAILTSTTGVTTVVGGKLTTYRRMAQDTLDALVADGRLEAGPCRTAHLPLLGAGSAEELAPRRGPCPARTPLRHRRRARPVHGPRGHRAHRRRAPRAGLGRRAGDARRAGLRDHPRGRARRRRPARPAYARRAGARRPHGRGGRREARTRAGRTYLATNRPRVASPDQAHGAST